MFEEGVTILGMTLTQGDITGLIAVYAYVAVLLVLTEFGFKKNPQFGRKLLHILTGNIAFILFLFDTREVMAFLAAGPFIFFTFLMSPYSPVEKLKDTISEAGHGLGLVYYSISWAVLAYLFFDNLEIIAIGILAMAYGDGLASLIGARYGKQRYRLVGDEKSYLGSGVFLVATYVMTFVALAFYGVEITGMHVFAASIVAIVAMAVEAVTPRGLDNLSVPITAALLYWLIIIA